MSTSAEIMCGNCNCAHIAKAGRTLAEVCRPGSGDGLRLEFRRDFMMLTIAGFDNKYGYSSKEKPMDVSRTREEVAELVMKIFDQLETGEFAGTPVLDAIILVELSDHDNLIDIGGGRMVPTTVVLLEATTDRLTLQDGILSFALKTITGEISNWSEEDEGEEGETDDPTE